MINQKFSFTLSVFGSSETSSSPEDSSGPFRSNYHSLLQKLRTTLTCESADEDLLPGGVVEVSCDLSQANGGVGPDAGLFVAEQPGKVFHDDALVQVVEVELRGEVDHGDHRLLPDDGLLVQEAVLDVPEHLVVHNLAAQVLHKRLHLLQEFEPATAKAKAKSSYYNANKKKANTRSRPK